jgi:hypothetical protein
MGVTLKGRKTVSESDDAFQAEVQRRIDAQARERAIAREVKRQGGHYANASGNWIIVAAIALCVGIGMVIYWYAHTPSQVQLQIGDAPTPAPGWVEPVGILLIVVAVVIAIRAVILLRRAR